MAPVCDEYALQPPSLLIRTTAVPQHNCHEPFTSAVSNFHWAEKTVARCESKHDHCRSRFIPINRRRYLPKRLLNVRSRDQGIVRLVLGEEIGSKDDTTIQYAALTHCWGGTVESELTEGNHEALQTIPIESLDRNFRDAVDITHKMGLDFLWIDLLYIIQRTAEWEKY